MRKILTVLFLLSSKYCAAQYCIPTVAGASGNNVLANFSLAGYGDSINDNGPATVPGNGYEDMTGTVAVINLQQGGAYSASITQPQNWTETHGQIWIDFNNDNIFEPSESVTAVFGTGGVSSNYYSFTLNIPFTAPLGTHRMRIRDLFNNLGYSSALLDPCGSVNNSPADTSINANGTTRDYNVNIIGLPSCSGVPSAGTAYASVAYACAGTPVTLSDTGYTMAAISLQWQSSADSTNWTNISGATSTVYTFSGQGATTYYRLVATCGTNNAYSNGVKITEGPCYCMPVIYAPQPFQFGMRVFSVTGYAGSSIFDPGPDYVTDTAIFNQFPYNYQYGYQPVFGYEDRTAAFAPLVLQQGNNYSYSGSVTGDLGLGVLSYYNGYGGLNYVRCQVWIDFNDNGTFEPAEAVTGAFGFNGDLADSIYRFTLSIPLMATPGAHRMRVRSAEIADQNTSTPYLQNVVSIDPCNDSETANGTAIYNHYGMTRDYEVTIIAAPPACAGTPSPGTAFANIQYACGSTAITLTDTGYAATEGLSMQWQSSADSISWNNISGATVTPYTILNQDTGTYYRCVVKCTNTGDSSISNAVLVRWGACYCIPTLWLLNDTLYNPNYIVVYPSMLSVPGDLYRMTNFTLTAFGGTGINDNGQIPADEGGYEDRTQAVAVPDLQQGNSYTGSVSENTNDSMYNQVWIDFNDDGTFDASEAVTVAFGYNGTPAASYDFTMNIPANATKGHHRMRARSVYGEGVYHYLVSTSPTTGYIVNVTTNNLAGLSTCNLPANLDYDYNTTYMYGMTRDYEVNITGASCDTVTGVTVDYTTQNSALIFWSPVPAASLYNYVIDQNTSAPAGGGTVTTATAVLSTGLAPGTVYYAHVRVDCGAGSYSAWTTTPFVTCDTLTNITVSNVQTTAATVSWSATASGSGSVYILDQDEATPTGGGISVLTNFISLQGLGCQTVYYLHIRSVCSGDSTLWQTVPFTTANCPGPNGINSVAGNDAFSMTAYPNPARAVVNVTVNGITGNATIVVTDVVGQTMKTIKPTENSSNEIDMSGYTPGIYFIKYTDDVHIHTVKISKQ